MKGKLYLIPNSLGHEDPDVYLPSSLKSLITSFRYLIVENTRNARRYLKSINRETDIDRITFLELNKHTAENELYSFMQPLLDGEDVGVISEAGLPGVADPGAKIAMLAHQKGIKVIPLTGPSSIFLALMASGLNGQSFCFSGYLPIKRNERVKAIRSIERRALEFNETQIFIETPYRNNALLKDIVTSCKNNTLLSIAADITMDTEYIETRTIENWRKGLPDLHKRPTVFLIGS
ncbi:MAG: SAM-dependent methyltransferase [Bacteroidales bacterium]|nr:SAM-dependent methyltransferase [Bacteroidales bacterium]